MLKNEYQLMQHFGILLLKDWILNRPYKPSFGRAPQTTDIN